MRVLGLEKDESYIAEDFCMPYETAEELAKRGLVKVIYTDGAPVAEAPTEDVAQPETEEPKEPLTYQDPLESSLMRALASADIADRMALAQAERDGFDKIIEEGDDGE
jgi:hypothetical protein